MKECIAFLLPPLLAFAGMRIARLLLGRDFESLAGPGLRWALGLGIGMLVFTQMALLGALAGVNLAQPLAWLGLIWGLGEVFLLIRRSMAGIKTMRFQAGHLWLLLLLPVLGYCWIFGRLSTLEGTLEFDANAFWVFKAKVLYLEQGSNLSHWIHQEGLAYAHWDYPMLVPCLYLLDYGAVGGVDEFVNKIWPFWMVIALCLGTLSMAKIWQRPHPLPLLAVVVLCFLPATLYYTRQEGGTMPLLFFVTLTAMLLVKAISTGETSYVAGAMLTAVGGAMTKFEGIIYLMVWLCVLLPFCLRGRWHQVRILWRTAAACVICVLPYVWFRLDKPVRHPESGWWRDGLTAPAATLHRFPEAWFLNVGGRFFNGNFFHWQSNHGHLQWIGAWTGADSLLNEQLAALPWLLLVVTAMALWQKDSRRATASLVIVIAGAFTVLTLAMCCLPFIQSDLDRTITYSSSEDVGRYSYPFFTAWFLSLVVIWSEKWVTPPESASPPDHSPMK